MVQNGLMIDVQLLGDATTAVMAVYLDIFHDFIDIYDGRPARAWCIIHPNYARTKSPEPLLCNTNRKSIGPVCITNFLGRFRRVFPFQVVKM